MSEKPNIHSDREPSNRQSLIYARDFFENKEHEPDEADNEQIAKSFIEAFDKAMEDNMEHQDVYEIGDGEYETTLELEYDMGDNYRLRIHLHRVESQQKEIAIQEVTGSSRNIEMGLMHRYYVDAGGTLRRFDRDFSTDMSSIEIQMTKRAIEEAGIGGLEEILRQNRESSKFEQDMGLNHQRVDQNEVDAIATILKNSSPRN